MNTGVYVHIPFCKSRCRYCDFYSTTLQNRYEAYVLALQNEIRTEKKRFSTISTVYFGGGTPSLLPTTAIANVLQTIAEVAKGYAPKEVTMEANPGDLSIDKLKALRKAGVNRLSIGIQTFHTPLLQQIGRRHTREEAINAVKWAQEAGFDNISIDLMYGLPGETMQMWQEDVEMACSLGVQHVSAYCLTYEEGTPLYKALEDGLVEELDDDTLNQMQDYAILRLAKAGIMRYEVSNFAVSGCESQHNSSYWTHTAYIGIGAGAHSYDGKNIRTWNPDDVEEYIRRAQGSAQSLQEWHGSEFLTDDDIYNETIMLGLRTVKGVEIKCISADYLERFYSNIQPYIAKGWLGRSDTHVYAMNDGWHMLNQIIEDIMI